jgi:DNA-binding XRE family transcriptional regulator
MELIAGPRGRSSAGIPRLPAPECDSPLFQSDSQGSESPDRPSGTAKPNALMNLNIDATGRQLQAARVMAGLTQAQLAELAGISRATLMNIESGETEPRLATYRAIVFALEDAGVTITEDGVKRVPGRSPALT